MKGQHEKQIIDLRKEVDALLAVRNENDQLKEELTRLQQAMTEDQKKNDVLLLQAKERIERLEVWFADISLLSSSPRDRGGGYSHVKAYGDVPPKWITFFLPKILKHGSKQSLEEGPISQKLRKTYKISRFEVEKPL